MSKYLGDFPVNASFSFLWNTNGQDGASITRSTDGTLKIYKNANVAERASLAGVTQVEDFDVNTGVHSVAIDLSDNTDAGFYAAGNEYSVVMVGMVIDTKTVNAEIACFSIERAGGALALLKSGTYGLAMLVRSTAPANTLDVSATGEAGLDFNNVKAATGATTLTNITVPTVTTVGTCTTNTDMRGTDAAMLAANGALEATLTAMKGGTFNGGTDSLEALRNQGDAAWLTADVSALALEATVAALNNITAADVKTAIEAGGGSIALIKAATDRIFSGSACLDSDAPTAGSVAETLRYLALWCILGQTEIVKATGAGTLKKRDGATAVGTFDLTYNAGTDKHTRTPLA